MTRIWALSDGRAGIERQAMAFAHALFEEIQDSEVERIRVSPRGFQLNLPPSLWFAPLGALPQDQREVFNNPPDILIANGRRSIAYSLYLKKKLGDDILTVQIQDPHIPSNKFDYVIAPKHDAVQGDNVFETLGGLVYYSQEQIENAREQYEKRGPTALLILGGNSKTHKFTLVRARQIIAQLKLVSGYDFCITTSRRTPLEIVDAFRHFAISKEYDFYAPGDNRANPYLSWLCNSDIAFITEDSANMLSDAAFFGLPINILRLEGKSKKFDELHQSFIKAGAAEFFTGKVFKNVNILPNNIKTIAKDIAEHWQARHK